MSEVLVIGDAIVDFVFDGIGRLPDPGEETVASQYELRPGGSAGYASVGLSALGVKTHVATLVGRDPLSDRWLNFVGAQGVNTASVDRVPDETISTAAAFLTKTDRSFVTYRGACGSDRVFVPEAGNRDAVLVTGFSQAPYLWSEELISFIQSLSNQDVSVLLDTNWSSSEWHDAFAAVAPAVDYLLVNDQEARRLGDSETVAAAGQALIDCGVGTCVVKTGADGCTLVDSTGSKTVETEPRDAIDVCGAGDFFNAGFVAALLDERTALAAAANGNRCAGEAIQAFAIHEKLNRIRGLS